jgi:hypothetical protein
MVKRCHGNDIDMQKISSIHGKIIELKWEDAEMKSVLSAVTHWRLSSVSKNRDENIYHIRHCWIVYSI